MRINRPPVTGEPAVDSWADEVTRALQQSSTSTGTSDSSSGVDIDAIVDAVVARVQPTNAVTLVLYKRWDEAVLPTSEYISVDTEYTYSSGVLRDLTTNSITNFDGWTREVPDVSQGTWLYSCQVNIADTAPSEVIQSTNWSTPVLVSVTVGQAAENYDITTSGTHIFTYNSTSDTTSDPQFSDVTITATSNLGTEYTCKIRVAINTGVTFNQTSLSNCAAALVDDLNDKFEIDRFIILNDSFSFKKILTTVIFKPTGQSRIITGGIAVIDSIN